MTAPLFELRGERLGEMLVKRGIISAAQLDEALDEHKRTGKFFGTVVVAKGWASEEEVAKTLSEQLGLAFVDLASHPIEPGMLELIPPALCRAHQAVPLFTMGESITVAMANPLDTAAVDEMQRASQRHIWPVCATPSAIRAAIDENAKQSPGGKAPAHGWSQPRAESAAADPLEAESDAGAGQAQVVQLVNRFVSDAIAATASDIHLEPMPDSFRCRFRIDGILHDHSTMAKETQAAVISRIKVMANMDIAEKRLPQDGRIQTTAAGRTIDLRVSTFPTIHGENVVIRILDKQRAVITLEQLGFSEETFALFASLIVKPHGIILVTGPTGSGKTTTLYGALNRLNSSERNIMTLEDPVEYELPGVRQAQVNLKAGLTFATGLRSMVRQDPDIVLIGEIRDKETADIAIHASLTGHLVFSTLHTNDAASAATRLVDMGVEPFLVATSLTGVLAQRLVRVLCDSCKRPYAPTPQLVERLGLTADKPLTFYQEMGCEKCRKTGYQGRIGVFELLVPTDTIRPLIAQKARAGKIAEEAVRQEMTNLRQDGIQKVLRGLTSVSEMLRVTGEE